MFDRINKPAIAVLLAALLGAVPAAAESFHPDADGICPASHPVKRTVDRRRGPCPVARCSMRAPGAVCQRDPPPCEPTEQHAECFSDDGAPQ